MSGKIYCITNIRNNKKYIGQTHRSLHERFREHCGNSGTSVSPKLKNAIKKYGKESFKLEILWEKVDCSDEELNQKEIEFIQKLNTVHPNGYNLTYGGSGGRHSDETKKLLSEKSHKMWSQKGEELRKALIERNFKRFAIFCFNKNKKLVGEYSSMNRVIEKFGMKYTELKHALKTTVMCKEFYFSRDPRHFKNIVSSETREKLRQATKSRTLEERLKYCQKNKKHVYCFVDKVLVHTAESLKDATEQSGISMGRIRYSIEKGTLCDGIRFSYSALPL